LRQAYDYWQDQPGNQQHQRAKLRQLGDKTKYILTKR